MNKNKLFILFLTLTLTIIQPISAKVLQPSYTQTTTLVTGLKNPTVWDTDNLGNTIFTQDIYDGNSQIQHSIICILYPNIPSYADLLIEEYGARILCLDLDAKGNIYYCLDLANENYQIKKLGKTKLGYKSESTILFSTEEEPMTLEILTVSSEGDVYFSGGLEWPNTVLCRINAANNEIETLLTCTFSIRHIELPKNDLVNPHIYYSCKSEYFTQIRCLNLKTMKEKVLQDKISDIGWRNTFCYLATGYKNDLYTYYRDRNDVTPATGYLEISYSAGALSRGSRIVFSQSYERWVMFATNRRGMQVSLQGNMFFTINLGPEPYTNTLIWYNPKTNTLKTVAPIIGPFITFALDKSGNIYYADDTSIHRINV